MEEMPACLSIYFVASPIPDMVSKQSTDEHVPFALGRRGRPKKSLGIFRFSWHNGLTTK